MGYLHELVEPNLSVRVRRLCWSKDDWVDVDIRRNSIDRTMGGVIYDLDLTLEALLADDWVFLE